MVTTPRIQTETENHRGRWIAAWLLLWTIAVIVVGIWLIDNSQHRAAKRLQITAADQAERIRDRIEADLQILRAMPMVLAAQVNARQLLMEAMRNPNEPVRSASLNAHYKRIASMTGIDTIFLADANGRIIAAHSFTTSDAQSLLGHNASEREYFAEAKAGQQGEQFAIAKLSKLPSVFFSAPVIQDGVFIGAVVVKSTNNRMRNFLNVTGQPRALLVDANKVAIAASQDDDFLRRVDTTTPLAGNLDQRYESAKPDNRPIIFEEHRSYNGVTALTTTAGEGPYIKQWADLNDQRWSVCVMLGTQQITKVTRQWRIALTLIWLVGALLLLLVIRSVRHLHDLDRLANIDVLSGLGNRRHYEAVVESLCDAHDRDRIQHVALALFDLDNFKHINDKHGHAAGDRVIEQFGDHLTKSTRRMDHLFRLGGDEFAALILELTPKAAEQAVTGIQARLRLASGTDDDLPQTSVSIGLAYHRSGEDPDALYRRADRAMYAAKEHGRNRVEVADETAG